MLQIIIMLNTMKNLITKNPKFTVGDHVRISKIFLLKNILVIGQKKFLLLIKLKIQFHGLIVLVI